MSLIFNAPIPFAMDLTWIRLNIALTIKTLGTQWSSAQAKRRDGVLNQEELSQGIYTRQSIEKKELKAQPSSFRAADKQPISRVINIITG